MENKKIIDKLNGLKSSLDKLKNQHHSTGDNNLKSYGDLLERIIDRIYPEKDAKGLKEKLINRFWILTGNETDEYWQKSYLDKIDRAIRVINTILEESELFGFEDFKPIKEKVETEFGINKGKFSLFKRKTKDK